MGRNLKAFHQRVPDIFAENIHEEAGSPVAAGQSAQLASLLLVEI
jgi:hypothetical protein